MGNAAGRLGVTQHDVRPEFPRTYMGDQVICLADLITEPCACCPALGRRMSYCETWGRLFADGQNFEEEYVHRSRRGFGVKN
ncbi:High-affinity glucose transporter RGT2 [Fusarium oxysporum f. sp. albedinis]|nr:High-affinity glucose transporter RGT2 [Fusarium oxysporum f. sp. albedinis]